jgi:RecA-family ATPase
MIDIDTATNDELDAIANQPHWMNGAINAQDLQKKKFDPVRYLLPGYIPEGVTLLVGKPKIGKSWAALDLCIAVASNRFTLGTIKPAQGDVLYLALEDSQRRLKRRMSKLLQGDSAWPSRLTLQTTWRRASDGGLEDIKEWCKRASSPTLIMIDTLEKFRPPAKPGVQNYSADYDAITGLQAITKERPGLAIVLAHHNRKMDADDCFDTVSGTLGLTGAADTILIMRRHTGSVLLNVRGRDVEESQTPLQFNKATCRWTILGAEAAEEAISSERRQIIDALTAFQPVHENDGMSVTEIMAATERKDRNAVDQLLFKMVRDGDIRRVKRGIYALPQDVGKIDKKERNEAQEPDPQGKNGNLTCLTDLTDNPGPGGEISANLDGERQDDDLEIPEFLDRRHLAACDYCQRSAAKGEPLLED